MTAATVVGQRTKTSLEGRDPVLHGRPILLAPLLAQIEGAAFVARGRSTAPGTSPGPRSCCSVPSSAQRTRPGFSFVEILTMCPTGWFVDTEEAPSYLEDHLAAVHAPGVLKDEVDR